MSIVSARGSCSMLYQVFIGWIAAPGPQLGFAACKIHGQEYVSNARLIQPGKTYPKVYCAPPTSIGKANIG